MVTWAEFGYGKYLIVLFWYASAAYQASLIKPWLVFWQESRAKIPMVRPNKPDMLPKRTKKVQLGIITCWLVWWNIVTLFAGCFHPGSVEQGLIGQEGFGQDKETQKEKLTLLS